MNARSQNGGWVRRGMGELKRIFLDSKFSFKIYSYEVGTNYYWGTPYNIKNTIGNLVAIWKELAYQDDDYEVDFDFEVLSESDTTVGKFNARQATFRRTGYEGRYKTAPHYDIVKLMAFQYGNWIYVIQSQQSEYNWTDNFWNMMELVRASIDFV